MHAAAEAGNGAVLPYRGPSGVLASPAATPPKLRGALDGAWCELEGPFLKVGTSDPAAVQPVLDALRRAGLIVRRMHVIRPTLEELFFEAVIDPTTGMAHRPGAAKTAGRAATPASSVAM
jgi:hypothetical protein